MKGIVFFKASFFKFLSNLLYSKKVKVCLPFFLMLVFTIRTSAQGIVAVNPLTGAAGINIPVFTLRSGQAVLPISLSYSGTGIKPKDVEGTAGMGWQLNAGGQISRLVRGIPDDVIKDNGNNTMLGWMSTSNTGAAAIPGFNIQNDGSTCSKETTDESYINSNFAYNYDTEPDLFYVSAPGLSCELIYDRASGKFRPVEYQDLIITYTQNPSTGSQPGQITSFTITNDKGVVYGFTPGDGGPSAETVTETTTGGSQNYLMIKYLQYQHGITYYDSWALTGITDPEGNSIQLNYTGYPSRNGRDSVALYLAGSTTTALQYYDYKRVTPMVVTSIITGTPSYSSPQYVSFNWTTFNNTLQTGQTAVSSITGFGRTFNFTYSPVTYSHSGSVRNFLRAYTDAGCATPVNYQFSYIGETLSDGNYTTLLSDSTTHKIDYWGYYSTVPTSNSLIPSIYVNPSNTALQMYMIGVSASPGSNYSYTLANANRSVDPTVITYGSLNKLSYAQGGNTNIIYEPNDYYDVPSNSNVKGAGIRVKQVIDSIGSGSANNIIRNYSYTNPSTGFSSGKPLTLPAYAFALPYASTATGLTYWTSVTALSAYDLSGEDHSIMYGFATITQAGAGSTLYQYYVPATYWDTNASPGCNGCTTSEWAPTVDLMGRGNCTAAFGPVRNDRYAYPFIPNTNYDFERGLLQKVTSYNQNSTPQEVSEVNYTYQRSYTPSVITAFKYDNIAYASNTVTTYNKYNLYYNTSELSGTVISKVFDSGSQTASQSDTTTYTFGSTYHKLLTQVQKTNSDRNTVTSNMSYVKDYPGIAAGSNANVTALYYLQQENVNAPVETYTQVSKSGTTLTTGAALTLYKGYTPGSSTLYLPAQQLKMAQPAGTSSFTKFAVSGQTVTRDPKYFGVANIDNYDNSGFPVTVDDSMKNIRTTILDHYSNQPTAVFTNAAFTEVAFNDFDTKGNTPASTFTISGSGSFTPVGSHAGSAAGLYAGTQTFTSGTLTKNATAKNYIFSVWVNAPSGNVLTLTLTGISTHPAYTCPVSGWQYCEVKIPVGTLAASYTVSFTSGQSVTVDDILFYPDVAEVTTATYDPVFDYKIAETNTNGVSMYYTNDTWGRRLFTFDQDKNIVQKNTFITPADEKSFVPAITYSTTPTGGTPTGFSITGPDPCSEAGATVSWNFGDGTTLTAAIGVTVSHTFASANTYTVTATVNSPLFGAVTAPSKQVVVAPGKVALSYNSYTAGNGNISSVTFTSTSGGSNYSFTGTQLNSVTVLQGSYTVAVSVSGGTLYNSGTGLGYSCIYINGDCTSACSNFTASNNYSFSLTLTTCTKLNFTVSQYTCSHFTVN